MAQQFWIFKSEPDVYSFEDLKSGGKQGCCWEGVRNYQARNFLRDQVKEGDGVFFYHSGIKSPQIVGRATVIREGYPDHEQFTPQAKYFDPKATLENPRWYMVDIQYKDSFKRPVTLQEMREVPELRDMVLLRKGNRLSIVPVTILEWEVISKLGGVKA